MIRGEAMPGSAYAGGPHGSGSRQKCHVVGFEIPEACCNGREQGLAWG